MDDFRPGQLMRMAAGWLAWCPREANRNLADCPASRLLQPGEGLTYLRAACTPGVAWVRDARGVAWRVPADLLTPAEEAAGVAAADP